MFYYVRDFFIMPKLTWEQIEKKWEYKTQEMEKVKKLEAMRRIKEREIKLDNKAKLEIDRKKNQIIRKANAYINRKKSEYSRKCKNEIRRLQGKEEKVYKQRPITRNKKLQIALKLAQENARLRDTNADGC